MVIAVSILHKTEFAVFGTTYFLTQVPILLGGILVFRLTGRAHLGGVLG
jgi:hypothetical protein